MSDKDLKKIHSKKKKNEDIEKQTIFVKNVECLKSINFKNKIKNKLRKKRFYIRKHFKTKI